MGGGMLDQFAQALKRLETDRVGDTQGIIKPLDSVFLEQMIDQALRLSAIWMIRVARQSSGISSQAACYVRLFGPRRETLSVAAFFVDHRDAHFPDPIETSQIVMQNINSNNLCW
jgi:hypothetical protein